MNGDSTSDDTKAQTSRHDLQDSEKEAEGKVPEGADTSGLEDEDGDVVVSMVDVLEEEEALQESAAAVLGGSDDQNCTYSEGYIGRQALYSCLTCAKSSRSGTEASRSVAEASRLVAEASRSETLAGVCLACSHECHEGHDLVELYTKRNFRCDCGNSKFTGNPCKLCPSKESVNRVNVYNQNFEGLYCTCSRPYPDPDDPTDDVMIQCIACEDWFHLRHVCEFKVDAEEWDELICGACMDQYTFLRVYALLSKGAFDPRNKQLYSEVSDDVGGGIEVVDKEKKSERRSDEELKINDQSQAGMCGAGDQSETVVPINADQSKTVVPINGDQSNLMQLDAEDQSQNTLSDNKSQPSVAKISSSHAESNSNHPAGSSQTISACKLDQLDYIQTGSGWIGPVFWPASWRSELCRCPKCLKLYREVGVGYLLDEGDSIQAYEKRGKERGRHSTYEQGMEALSGLGRVQQMELLHGYADMKAELQEYLKKFIDNQKVVRSEDISEFFAQLNARKRRRLDEPPSQNYTE